MRVVLRSVDYGYAKHGILEGNRPINRQSQINALRNNLVVRGICRQQCNIRISAKKGLDDFHSTREVVRMGLDIPIIVCLLGDSPKKFEPFIKVGEDVVSVAVCTVKETVRRN